MVHYERFWGTAHTIRRGLQPVESVGRDPTRSRARRIPAAQGSRSMLLRPFPRAPALPTGYWCDGQRRTLDVSAHTVRHGMIVLDAARAIVVAPAAGSQSASERLTSFGIQFRSSVSRTKLRSPGAVRNVGRSRARSPCRRASSNSAALPGSGSRLRLRVKASSNWKSGLTSARGGP